MAHPNERGSPNSSILRVVGEQLLHQQETMMRQVMTMMVSTLEEVSSTIRAASSYQPMSIVDFDGASEDPHLWMTLYEKVCELNGWNDDHVRIMNLITNFPPHSTASKWFYSRIVSQGNDCWASWKESFLSAFGQNEVQLAMRAQDCTYLGGALMDYWYEKVKLLRQAYGELPDRALRIMILLGLPECMQDQICAIGISSAEQLRKVLERLRPIQPGENTTHFTETQDDSFVSPAKEEEEEGVDQTEDIALYSCSMGSSILPVLDLQVEGLPVSTLLDTGASVNIMRLETARKLNLVLQHDRKTLRGFNSAKENILQSSTVSVEYGSRKVTAKVYICASIMYDLIVGYNTMRSLGFSLENRHDTTPCCTSIEHKKYISSKEDVLAMFPANSKRVPLEYSIPFQLQDNAAIVCLKPYRLSREKHIWAQGKIRELLDVGIIRPSTSEYASPCVIVPKANGTWRLCQDYRMINRYTNLDPFPFPIIDDIICCFGGCTHFTKLDLKDGFHQVPLTENSKKYTSFVLPFGHFEFNYLPFGWKNSPPVFQRFMTKVLGDLLNDPLIWVYVDDILVGGRSEQECAQKTYLVIQRLNESHVKLNLEKSDINKRSVTFLGREIDGNSKTTKQESVEKVRKIQRPKDVHSLRVFTGLTGHFRAFIPNYSGIVRPLDRLKGKNVPFEWNHECEEAFKTLVEKITSNPILQLPDWDKPFELCTDASNFGCGAVLYQRDAMMKKNQQLRVVGYFSHTFTPAEANYSVTDKEALAVVTAIKYFRSYLEGREFIVHSDHQALSHLLNLKDPKGRLARWQLFLMGYNVIINHRKGTDLEDADALSRLCVNQKSAGKLDTVCLAQESNRRIDVSPIMKAEVLRAYHDDADSGGHDGFLRTYKKIRARFGWPGMKKEIREYVQSCHQCQMIKFKYRPKPDSMISPVRSDTPFECLHLDFGERKKKSEGSSTTQSFLIMVDDCSRMLFAKAMKESSKAVVHYLSKFPHINKVKRIISDNGPQFVSAEMRNFALDRGITLSNSSPYHPEGNGMAERRMRDLKQYLALYPTFRGGWKRCLEAGVKHLNRSYCAAIGCSPWFKAFQEILMFPADDKFGITSDMIVEKTFSAEQEQKYADSMKKYFDKRHPNGSPRFQEGGKILVQCGQKGHEANVKGPYCVKRIVFMNNIPKTLIYDDKVGRERRAAVKNSVPYHCRSNESS